LRLAYQTSPGSPLRGFFKSIVTSFQGGTVTSADVGLNVVTRAVLVPRNGVFLIDFSESVTWMPFNIYAPRYTNSEVFSPNSCQGAPTNRRRRFVYEVEQGAVCNTNGTTLLPSGNQNPYTLGFLLGQEGEYINCVYQANPVTSPPGPNSRANEYQCADFSAASPIQYADGSTDVRSFLLNTVVRPEPLTSILEAVRRSMIEFQNRGVPGDRVGIVGFDQERIENRLLAEDTGAINTIRPSRLTNLQYANFIDALDPAKLPNDPARIERFLFPRSLTSSGYSVNTDYPAVFGSSSTNDHQHTELQPDAELCSPVYRWYDELSCLRQPEM
jgi:hypothetical protein